MFKKPGPDKLDPLAQRMRKIADVSHEETTYKAATTNAKRSDRKSTFKAATLTLISGERIDVVVKNVSETGARIEFLRDISLPDRVLLSEPTLRLRLWAYVAWQERGKAGLEFVKT